MRTTWTQSGDVVAHVSILLSMFSELPSEIGSELVDQQSPLVLGARLDDKQLEDCPFSV